MSFNHAKVCQAGCTPKMDWTWRDVLSREEIKSLLNDLRSNEKWFYPCFALWLGTGLKNADVLGF